MKLTDALTYLRSTMDQTHRFWAYHQAFTAGTVVLMWSPAKQNFMLYILAAGYTLFALFNLRLVVESQAAARQIWEAIQKYSLEKSEPIPQTFLPLLKLNEPDQLWKVVGSHSLLSVCVVGAILLRAWYQPQ